MFGMGFGSAELKIWGSKDAGHLAGQTEGEAIDASGSPNGGTQKGPTCHACGLAMVTVGEWHRFVPPVVGSHVQAGTFLT